MNIVVLAKYVPNPSGDPPEIGPDHRLRREEADGALDPADAPGVETALRLAEAAGGEVTVVSMGPEPAMRAVTKALAMGAERGVLVCDESLRAADALATAKVLAAAIRQAGFDLVVAAVESTDGATGTLPMTLSALLGVPCASFAKRVVLEDGRLSIERQTAAGYDVVACPLPAVVTVTAAIAEPRNPSLRDIAAARKKPATRLSLQDLDLEPADVAPIQAVIALELGSDERGGEIVDDPEQASERVVRFLEEAEVI